MLTQLAPAFPIGLLATLSPCVLPLYPGFLSYLGANAQKLTGQRGVRWLGVFVLLGVLTMMLILGAVIATLSVGTGQVLAIITPLADVIVVLLGIALIFGKNPFARLPQIRTPGGRENPYLSAYIYGFLYGPIALPCSGPLVISIFALSLGLNGFANQLLFFLVFGLGFGVPLLVISLLAQTGQQWVLRKFTKHYSVINRVGGLLLIAVGVWDFFVNFDSIRLYLGLA
jgi:cytochrome c-type biogenesis protein